MMAHTRRNKIGTIFTTVQVLLKIKPIVMKKTLLLAGIGALAYYMYKKMSPEEKENISRKIKDAGKKLSDQLPGDLKNIFGNKPQEV
jgi:hypothetical protein